MAVYFGSHIYNTSIYTLSIKDIGIWGEYTESIVNTNSNTNNSITSMNMGQSVSLLWSSLYTLHMNNNHIYSNILSKISKSSITNDMSTTTVMQPNNSATYYFLQLAGYAIAHNQIYQTNIQFGIILMCSKDLYYQEFRVEGEEFKHYANEWWKKVDQYYRQKKEWEELVDRAGM